MNDDQIDRLLSKRADMPVTLSEKIRARIQLETQPVKPLMPTGFYVLLFSLIFVVVAVLFASIYGLGGLPVLMPMEAAEFLGTLFVLALASGAMVARSMRPGSGRLYTWLLGLLAFAAYEALVLMWFRNYSTTSFVHTGFVCFSWGVFCAAFVAIPLWLIVRRGFIVEPARAGAMIGLLSGLAGLTALTMHCSILTTPHAGVWHAAVIVFCTAAGAVAHRVYLKVRGWTNV